MQSFNKSEVWLNRLIILSAAVFPLYLSMFRLKVAGVLIRPADFLLIAVVALTLLLFPASRAELLRARMLPIYGLACYILFQSLFLGNYFSSIKEILQVLLIVLFMAVNGWLMAFNREKYLKYMLFFLVLSILYTVLYHVLNGQFVRYKLAGDGKYAFGLLSVLSFIGWKASSDTKLKYLFMLSLLPLFLSLERKGLFGLLMVISIYMSDVFLRWLKINSSHVYIIIFCILMVFVGVFLSSDFIESKIYMDNFLDESVAIHTSNIHRESLLINGFTIFLDNWVFGIGADNIREAMEVFYVNPNLANGTHNFYLEYLIKYGVLGALFWGATYLSVISKLSLLSQADKLFVVYCLFVVAFMSDGQTVLLLFLFPVFTLGQLFPSNTK